MRRKQSNVKDISIKKKKLTRELQVEQNDRMYHKTLESCSVRWNDYMKDYRLRF